MHINRVTHVTDILDTTIYPRTTNPDCCFCCGKDVDTVTGPGAYRGRFEDMTGLRWPGPLYLNIAKDLGCLGLDTTNVPAQALFCLLCAVDYMYELNRRLDLAQLTAGRVEI